MAITIRSGKILPIPYMGKPVVDKVVSVKPKESGPVESEKLDNFDDAPERSKEKEKEVVLKTIPRSPPPFP